MNKSLAWHSPGILDRTHSIQQPFSPTHKWWSIAHWIHNRKINKMEKETLPLTLQHFWVKSRLSTINSYGYGFEDSHDFSGYRSQKILDTTWEICLDTYSVRHLAEVLLKLDSKTHSNTEKKTLSFHLTSYIGSQKKI